MKPFEDSFAEWLSSRKSILDVACSHAIRQGLQGMTSSQIEAANDSLLNLYADTSSGIALPGGDCDYSLPGVGALYTGHWHGKRIHDAISVLVPLRHLFSGHRSTVIDVESGVGAALWAWTLIAVHCSQTKAPLPMVTWNGIDASQEMNDQSNRLWTSFVAKHPLAKQVVDRKQVQKADWRSPPQLPTKAAVLGSYLFSRLESNKAIATSKQFVAFLERVVATAIVIWTKPNKRAILDAIKSQLRGWTDLSPKELYSCPLQGRMHQCVAVASSKCSALKMPTNRNWPRQFNWGTAPSNVAVLAMIR